MGVSQRALQITWKLPRGISDFLNSSWGRSHFSLATSSSVVMALGRFLGVCSGSGVLMGASLFSISEKAALVPVAPRLVKMTDLPIYDEPAPPRQQAYYVEPKPVPLLEQKISEVRRAVTSWWGGSEKVREKIHDTYEIGKAHTQSTLELVRDDTKVLPRAVLISAGGLVGFLGAYRRGILPKIIYTSLGLGSAAILCYPKAGQEIGKAGYIYVRNLFDGLEKKTPTSSTQVQLKSETNVDPNVKKI